MLAVGINPDEPVLRSQPKVLLGILLEEIDAATGEELVRGSIGFKGITLRHIAAEASFLGRHPDGALTVAADAGNGVAGERARVVGMSHIVTERGGSTVLAEEAVVGTGSPDVALSILGETDESRHGVDFEESHKLLRSAVEAAKPPAGADVDITGAGAQQAIDHVAGKGVGAIGRVGVMATSAGSGVDDIEPFTLSAHPEGAAVHEQGVDLAGERADRGCADRSGVMEVVAVDARVGSDPDITISGGGEGTHHIAGAAAHQWR